MYILVKCELQITSTPEKLKELELLQAYFLDQQKPSKFDPHDIDNVLMTGEMSFEELCNTMEDQGSSNPKGLSEYAFYAKLQFYKKKFKMMTDANK